MGIGLTSVAIQRWLLVLTPSRPNFLEMWSSMSSSPMGHAGDTLSAGDIKVDKKNGTVTFPFLLCEGYHYSHLLPHMDVPSYLLENIQHPTGDS